MKMNLNKLASKRNKDKSNFTDLPHIMLYGMGGIMAVLFILMFTVPAPSMNLWIVLMIALPLSVGVATGVVPMMKQASPVFDAFSAGFKDSLNQIEPALSFPIVTNQKTRIWNVYLGGGFNAFSFTSKGRKVILVPKNDVIQHGGSVITFNNGKLVSVSQLPQMMQDILMSRIDFEVNSKIWYMVLPPRPDLVTNLKTVFGAENSEFGVNDMLDMLLEADTHASFVRAKADEQRDMMSIRTTRKSIKEIRSIDDDKEEKYDQ